ncbi:MAG TPA: methylenetetrahydrofolate reductase [NAD(P)H] [Phycisphaerales bacterium]|nr:methylenetetrahydrofolate reductase [NAD(P)H] [Phycisphaerales bacterium]
MHIRDVFNRQKTTFSFEFFPPKSAEGADRLFKSISELERLEPAFVSVTYGAGGATRDLTNDLVVRINKETSLDAMPHLTCVCHSRDEIQRLLERYAAQGISNILALRGDPPADNPDHRHEDDDYRFAAQLVGAIRRFNELGTHPNGKGFGIGVAGFPAGHPATPNRLDEMDHLRAKVDAGADFIITQLFFDNASFLDFRDRCRFCGIDIPIIAGIMPLTSLSGMRRMAQLALGTHFPARLLRALDRTDGTPESIRRVGVHWATEQCVDLLDHGVDGIHFYTLNQSTATREIYATLGVQSSSQLSS